MERSPPLGGPSGARSHVLLALVLAIAVTTAGCASIEDAGGTPGATTETAGPTEAAGPTETDASATASGHSHSHGGAANGTADGHSTGASDDGSTVNATDAGSGGTATDGASTNGTISGQMTVVVGDQEVTEGVEVDANGFQFDAGDAHTWRATGNVTLAEALAAVGVEGSGDTLTYEGRTYDGDQNGTTVSVRVNGDPVDPSTYALADGDEVWVTVDTPGMNRSTPGEYIDNEDQHVHGHMEFVVNGEAINFGRERYQSNDRYFHYEGGEGAAWHAHSYSLTLDYALSSLNGIDVSADGRTVTYNGTTYRESEPGTTIAIEVNGEPVEPGEYYLKDWDGVRVVVESA